MKNNLDYSFYMKSKWGLHYLELDKNRMLIRVFHIIIHKVTTFFWVMWFVQFIWLIVLMNIWYSLHSQPQFAAGRIFSYQNTIFSENGQIYRAKKQKNKHKKPWVNGCKRPFFCVCNPILIISHSDKEQNGDKKISLVAFFIETHAKNSFAFTRLLGFSISLTKKGKKRKFYLCE